MLLAFAGAGFMVQMAATNTIIQTIVDERFRGRVMAFYTMAFFGTVPSAASSAGARRPDRRRRRRSGSAASCAWPPPPGSRCMLPTLRPLVRKIYIERGIIAAPDVDPGSATP